MPFQSRRQWKKFAAMAARGEIAQGTFKEWARATPGGYAALPEKKKKKTPAP